MWCLPQAATFTAMPPAAETDSDCDEASRAKRPPQVPPCVWAERAKGRRLRTELHYTGGCVEPCISTSSELHVTRVENSHRIFAVLDGSARSARVVYVDPK